MLDLIVEFGCWKDLFRLLKIYLKDSSNINHYIEIENFIVNQFKDDIHLYNEENIFDMSKLSWSIPRETSNYNKKNKITSSIVKKIYGNKLSNSFKQFRMDMKLFRACVPKPLIDSDLYNYYNENYLNSNEFNKALEHIREKQIDFEIARFLDNLSTDSQLESFFESPIHSPTLEKNDTLIPLLPVSHSMPNLSGYDREEVNLEYRAPSVPLIDSPIKLDSIKDEKKPLVPYDLSQDTVSSHYDILSSDFNFDTQSSTFDSQSSTFDSQSSTFDSQSSTFDSQSSTFDSQSSKSYSPFENDLEIPLLSNIVETKPDVFSNPCYLDIGEEYDIGNEFNAYLDFKPVTNHKDIVTNYLPDSPLTPEYPEFSSPFSSPKNVSPIQKLPPLINLPPLGKLPCLSNQTFKKPTLLQTLKPTPLTPLTPLTPTPKPLTPSPQFSPVQFQVPPTLPPSLPPIYKPIISPLLPPCSPPKLSCFTPTRYHDPISISIKKPYMNNNLDGDKEDLLIDLENIENVETNNTLEETKKIAISVANSAVNDTLTKINEMNEQMKNTLYNPLPSSNYWNNIKIYSKWKLLIDNYEKKCYLNDLFLIKENKLKDISSTKIQKCFRYKRREKAAYKIQRFYNQYVKNNMYVFI